MRRVRNQEFVVRRRESYYMHNGKQVRAKPYFNEIRVKVIEDCNTALLALKAGQIDEHDAAARAVGQPDQRRRFLQAQHQGHGVEWTEFHFVWNTETPFFSDKRVRQAMSYAFDYDELLNVICHGLYEPVPRHVPSRRPGCFPRTARSPIKQDLDKAEDLLDEAGWTDSDGDGIRDKEINGRRVPFEFTLLTYQTETGMHGRDAHEECPRPDRHHLQREADRVHRARRSRCKSIASRRRWAAGARAPIPTTRANIVRHRRSAQLRPVFQPASRRAVRARLARVRPREAGRDLRRDPQHPVGRPAVHLALLPQRVLRIQQEAARLQLRPAGPFHFSPGIDSIYKPVSAC